MLRFNGLSPTSVNPFSAMCTSQIGFTAAAVANTANLTTQWGRGERHGFKLSMGELASNPPATQSPTAWTLAGKGGELAAENSVNQSNVIAFNLQRGIDLSASLTQDASITAAALSMITSMEANLQQEGQLTGAMQLTMNIAANLINEAQIDAGLGLIAWMQANLTQDVDMSASNLRGTQSMEANIVSYSALTPEGIRDVVWQAVLANYPVSGTAGNTLALAGSGGVDYTALGIAVWTSVTRTLTSGSGPTTEDITAALREAILPINVVEVVGIPVTGTGTQEDPWGPP